MHWGVERRVARRLEEDNGADEARLISGEPGEAGQNTTFNGWRHPGEDSGGGENLLQEWGETPELTEKASQTCGSRNVEE